MDINVQWIKIFITWSFIKIIYENFDHSHEKNELIFSWECFIIYLSKGDECEERYKRNVKQSTP